MKKLLTLLKEAGVSPLQTKTSRYPNLFKGAANSAKELLNKIVSDLEKTGEVNPDDILKLNVHIVTIIFDHVADPKESETLSITLANVFNRIKTYTESFAARKFKGD